jgi:hypothetical protein
VHEEWMGVGHRDPRVPSEYLRSKGSLRRMRSCTHPKMSELRLSASVVHADATHAGTTEFPREAMRRRCIRCNFCPDGIGTSRGTSESTNRWLYFDLDVTGSLLARAGCQEELHLRL